MDIDIDGMGTHRLKKQCVQGMMRLAIELGLWTSIELGTINAGIWGGETRKEINHHPKNQFRKHHPFPQHETPRKHGSVGDLHI